jgi:hypothetical protein
MKTKKASAMQRDGVVGIGNGSTRFERQDSIYVCESKNSDGSSATARGPIVLTPRLEKSG